MFMVWELFNEIWNFMWILFSYFNQNISFLKNDLNFPIWWLHTQSKTGGGWDSLFEICFIFQVKSCKSSKYKADVISSAGKMNVTQAGCRNASKISYCQLARSSVLAGFFSHLTVWGDEYLIFFSVFPSNDCRKVTMLMLNLIIFAIL